MCREETAGPTLCFLLERRAPARAASERRPRAAAEVQDLRNPAASRRDGAGNGGPWPGSRRPCFERVPSSFVGGDLGLVAQAAVLKYSREITNL